MTVGELIEELKKLNPDDQVMVWEYDQNEGYWLSTDIHLVHNEQGVVLG